MMSLNSISTCTSCFMLSGRSANRPGCAASAPAGDELSVADAASAAADADAAGDCCGGVFGKRTRIFRALFGVGGGCNMP